MYSTKMSIFYRERQNKLKKYMYKMCEADGLLSSTLLMKIFQR